MAKLILGRIREVYLSRDGKTPDIEGYRIDYKIEGIEEGPEFFITESFLKSLPLTEVSREYRILHIGPYTFQVIAYTFLEPSSPYLNDGQQGYVCHLAPTPPKAFVSPGMTPRDGS